VLAALGKDVSSQPRLTSSLVAMQVIRSLKYEYWYY